MTRMRTADRGPPEEAPPIYTVEKLGPKRERTENGNLICYDVPIARTGYLTYMASELPLLKPGPDGLIRVNRSADELFSAMTIGSFMGVAVVDDHPPNGDDVTPKNWKRLAHGFTTTNVRRGTGDDSDVLFADLIITDEYLIKAILDDNKIEVSAGYEASYKQIGPGLAESYDIVGNHVALVDRGRCGPRCAIGDHATTSPPLKGKTMPQPRKQLTPAAKAALRVLIGDAEAEGLFDDTQDPPQDAGGSPNATGEGGATHVHIHMGAGGANPAAPEGGTPNMPNTMATDNAADPNAAAPGGAPVDPMEQRVAALEANMAKILELLQGAQGDGAPDAPNEEQPGEGGPPTDPDDNEDATRDELPEELAEEGDKRAKTGDSAALANSFQQLVADCEVLVPGMRMPTFDAKAKRMKTVDAMCGVRRRTLDHFYMTKAGKEVVDSITGQTDLNLDGMKCGGIATLFRSAAGAQRLINNRMATKDSGNVVQMPQPGNRVPSITELNKQYAAHWAKRQA